MCEDSPDDLAADLVAEAFWAEDSLARPILGTADTVSSFVREQLVAHVARYYVAGNVVLSVVGNVQEEEMLRLVRRYFTFPAGEVSHAAPLLPRGNGQVYRHKDVEQCNLIYAFDGLARYDEDSYAMLVLDEVLGGGMSSILFQRVREELSLAYSVYSYTSQYEGRGSFGIYLGTAPAKLAKAADTVAQIVLSLRKDGITAEQLERGRNQSLANYVFATESSSALMRAQARNLLHKGEAFDPDAEIERINRVTLEQVNALARRLFAAAPAAGLVAKKNMDCIGYFDGK